MAFEEVSSRIVNAESGEESEKIVSELIGDHDGTSSSKVANVFVARDTRTSGPYLCGLAIEVSNAFLMCFAELDRLCSSLKRAG